LKIGIVTLVGYSNYGNRLQNYALQQTLISLGHDCNTIKFIPYKNIRKRNIIFRYINYFRRQIIKFLKHLINSFRNKEYKVTEELRFNNFWKFSKKYINETKEYDLSNGDDLRILNHYDYFIVGSDQVWNPNYINDPRISFLRFIPRPKRISYAASFGVMDLPESVKADFAKYLDDFKALSVREDRGAEIIEELLGIIVPVLPDPTLMLCKEKWLQVSNKQQNANTNKYILTYFLGKQPRKTYLIIDKIAKQNGFSVINLCSIKEKESYRNGPSEFIDLVHNCELLMTDSFHGSVFSIIFKKPFVVFDREDMNSRIATLLRTFHLESRHWVNISKNMNLFEMKYENIIDDILHIEQNKAIQYLKENLRLTETIK